jgi:hypothetical protein
VSEAEMAKPPPSTVVMVDGTVRGAVVAQSAVNVKVDPLVVPVQPVMGPPAGSVTPPPGLGVVVELEVVPVGTMVGLALVVGGCVVVVVEGCVVELGSVGRVVAGGGGDGGGAVTVKLVNACR